MGAITVTAAMAAHAATSSSVNTSDSIACCQLKTEALPHTVIFKYLQWHYRSGPRPGGRGAGGIAWPIIEKHIHTIATAGPPTPGGAATRVTRPDSSNVALLFKRDSELLKSVIVT